MNLRFYSFVVAGLAAAGCTGKTSAKTEISGSERGLGLYYEPVDEGPGATAKLRAESGEVLLLTFARYRDRNVRGQNYKMRKSSGARVMAHADCSLRDKGGLQAHVWTISRVKGSKGPWKVNSDRQIVDMLPFVEEEVEATKVPSGAAEPFCTYISDNLFPQILMGYVGMTDNALEVRQKIAVKKGNAEVLDAAPGVWLVDPISKSHDFEMDMLAAYEAAEKNRSAASINPGKEE